jgi:hypothetical protein
VADILPTFLVDYMERRRQQRADAVNETLAALTERELRLVKEAAVMGYVQGVRHHDLPMLRDSDVLSLVIDACHSFPVEYPTITRRNDSG